MKKIFFVLLGCFTLFCAYWAGGRSLLVEKITATIQTLESEGYVIDHEGLSAGGFPLKFRARLQEADITSPRSINKLWSLKADSFAIQASSLTPFRWEMWHRGNARVDLRGPKGERWLFDMRPMSLSATAKLSLGGKVKALSANMRRTQFQAVIGTLPPIVGLEGASLTAAPIKGNNQQTDMRYQIVMENVFLNTAALPELQKAFGPRIEQFTAVVLAKGLGSLEAEAAALWQKDGHLKTERWTLDWGDMRLQGSAGLTLSPAGASGVIHAEVEDTAALIAQMEAAGLLSERQAASVRIASLMLPVTDAGRQNITVNIRDGYLTLFGQKIYKF